MISLKMRTLIRNFMHIFYGTHLAHITELWYLDVWFDESLMWRRQIHGCISRASTRLWLLWRLGGRDWVLGAYLYLRGHPPHNVLWSFVLNIRFVLKYGIGGTGFSINMRYIDGFHT